MFEKYTETARKAVFVARYQASQFGSDYIEPAHLLLGILHADAPLALRLLKSPEKIESIREQIEKQSPHREKTLTSVDLPLSHECKRALAYAVEESGRHNHPNIAPEHLILGLLREEKSLASKIMAAHGLTAAQLTQEMIRLSAPGIPANEPANVSSLTKGARDLTAAARAGALSPLVGRESELERTIQILSRRTKNNPVLIGEPGVGKNALVLGLAQRIADGSVPASLADRPILAIDAVSLFSSAAGTYGAQPILYVHGLFDLAGKAGAWNVLKALHFLEPQLAHGGLQCIATGAPFGLRLTLERAETLASHFEVVSVLPPTEEEAIRILSGVKQPYETFHNVVVTKEAIEAAVAASRWFLRHRHLPDRAIDLLDDAGARVKLLCESEPREIVEIQKRIRKITRQMENAIANHEFDKARLHSDEERKARENLERLRREVKQNPRTNVLAAEDILEAVAGRAGVSVSAVRIVLQVQNLAQLDLVAKDLAAQLPFGTRGWAENLAAYLSGCSDGEAEQLAQAIRSAKARIESNKQH
jgi:ATP-dependent Clp protease ATP-binding subunit ClpC